MSLHVYLFKIEGLYNIGFTSNLEKTKKSLKPGILIASLQSSKAELIKSQLHDLFIESKLPSSDYFKLSKAQVAECKNQLERIGGRNYFQPLFIGSRLFFAFLFSWILISAVIIKFAIDPVLSRFI